jgi:large repetitive protein
VRATWSGAIYAAAESEGTQPGAVEMINPAGSQASSLSIEPVNPSLLPAGVVAPTGALSFSLGEVAHGGTIDVTLKLPPGSEPTEVYKWAGSEYRLYPAEKVKIAGNEITLALTDNEAPWDEAPELGVIRDPVVPVHAQLGTPPTVSKVSPSHGRADGGKAVKIAGTGFTGVTRVKFGATNATSVTVNSPTSLTAVSPAGLNGKVDVTVWTPSGGSPTSTADSFQFEGPAVTNLNPDFGATGGGTTIVVKGAGFATGSATAFKLGKVPATSVDCTSTTACTVVAPAAKKGKAGAVDVTVTVAGKTSKKRPPADQFTYN